MSEAVWCKLCKRNVVPTKKSTKFVGKGHWVFFIIFYVPYFFLRLFTNKTRCPICNGSNFEPAHTD